MVGKKLATRWNEKQEFHEKSFHLDFLHRAGKNGWLQDIMGDTVPFL